MQLPACFCFLLLERCWFFAFCPHTPDLWGRIGRLQQASFSCRQAGSRSRRVSQAVSSLRRKRCNPANWHPIQTSGRRRRTQHCILRWSRHRHRHRHRHRQAGISRAAADSDVLLLVMRQRRHLRLRQCLNAHCHCWYYRMRLLRSHRRLDFTRRPAVGWLLAGLSRFHSLHVRARWTLVILRGRAPCEWRQLLKTTRSRQLPGPARRQERPRSPSRRPCERPIAVALLGSSANRVRMQEPP